MTIQVSEMKSKFVALFVTSLIPGLVLAQGETSYQCNFENLQRRIEILTEPGVTVPCEVHYYKDSEMPGEKQVLWSASSEEGYCESKTLEFVAKLTEWGWTCGPSAAAEPAATPEPAMEPEPADDAEPAEPMSDDTDALEPAG
jgi:hypothetical protein